MITKFSGFVSNSVTVLYVFLFTSVGAFHSKFQRLLAAKFNVRSATEVQRWYGPALSPW